MIQSPEIRAAQHLLVQGFTLYPCSAAVCTRVVDKNVLDNPNHTWAIICDERSLQWTATLPNDDALKAELGEAAVRSADPTTPHVLCHTAGARLLLPLTATDVRDARMRIEAAVALGKAPPAERLEAFPDHLIQQEAERRNKLKDQTTGKAMRGEH